MIHFFNAGAGSGKTYRLSEELSSFLLEKGGKPSEVILTTFTIKSAEELKERVRSRMHEKKQAHKAAEMSTALIGTINSVCSRLVEKYAMEQGLGPGLRVLDDQSSGSLFSEFISSAVSAAVFDELNGLCSRFSLYENGDPAAADTKDELKPAWPRMVKCLGEKFRAYNVHAADVELSKTAAREQISAFLQPMPEVTLNATLARIEQEEKFPLAAESFSGADKDIAEALNRLSAMIASGSGASIKWEHFAKAGGNLNQRTKINHPWLSDLVLLCRQYYRSPEFCTEYQELTALLYDVSFTMIEKYQHYKQQRGWIDFLDQELLLLNMLENSQVVQREIAATYRLVMVDEFQDCSPVQLAIFFKLSSIIPNAVWVGDPKQSVYGFRDSDASLFNAAMNAVALQAGNHVASLTLSYRSRPPLVQAVNEVFAGIFSGQLSTDNITLTPCAHTIEREPDYLHAAIRVQFYEDTRIEDYLSSIATKLVETLRSDTRVYDGSTGEFRQIRGGDVALLFRTNTNIAKAARALKLKGLEVSCQAEGLQYQAEVLWLKSLLRLLVNPGDDLAVANIMLLENAADNVEQLIAERIAHLETGGRRMSWRDHSPVVLQVMAQRALLIHMPLAGSITHLITASELPMYMAQWGNPEQRMANIEWVIELATAYQQQCMVTSVAATCSGFVEHLSKCNQLPASGGEHAVTLTTVHRSKGLEWPMTILVKLDMLKDDCRVLFNQVHVLQPEFLDINHLLQGQKIIYLPWPFAANNQVGEDLAASRNELDRKLGAYRKFCMEEDRLLYVAMTRAREYLVLPYYKTSSGACIESAERIHPSPLFSAAQFQEMKKKATRTAKDYALSGITVSLQSIPKHEGGKKDVTAPNEEAVFYLMGEKKSGAVHDKRFISPSKAEKLTQGVRLSVLDYEGSYLPVNGVPQALQAILGQVVHHGFASWHPGTEQPERTTRLEALIERMQFGGYLNAQELDQRFEAFWNYLMGRYQATRIAREWPLMEVTAQQVTSGVADLVLDTAKGLVLIDHKTFPGNFDAMALNRDHDQYAGKYAAQLQTYKQLLEKATGRPVTHMLLHYAVQARLVEVKLNPVVQTKQAENQEGTQQLKLW